MKLYFEWPIQCPEILLTAFISAVLLINPAFEGHATIQFYNFRQYLVNQQAGISARKQTGRKAAGVHLFRLKPGLSPDLFSQRSDCLSLLKIDMIMFREFSAQLEQCSNVFTLETTVWPNEADVSIQAPSIAG